MIFIYKRIDIMTKRMTTEEFIKRAREKHKDKYIYTKTDLNNRDDKGRVIITCPIHGDFLQTPSAHLSGRSCNKCARPSYDTPSFIECAKKKHGDKYVYTKTNYINTKTDVIITCPIHGDFKTTPNRHLDGVGCPKCANKYSGKNGSYTTEDFIEKAKEKYGDKFSYSKTDLNNKDENGKVIVTCNELCIDGKPYGDLKILPISFITRGIKVKHFLTNEYFTRISKFIHGDKYDYSKTNVDELDKDGKVTIICPIHGEFKQNPHSHLRGDGCILCRNTKEGIFYNEFRTLYPNIEIVRQKHFDWLGKQSLDFYLPQYNTAIEYQGNFHFEYHEKMHKKYRDFEEQEERDKRKKRLCEINGVKLIYFTFDNKRKKFLNEIVYNKVIDLKNILL